MSRRAGFQENNGVFFWHSPPRHSTNLEWPLLYTHCHTCISQPDVPLPPLWLCLQLPSGLRLLLFFSCFSLSFCCLVNSAFSCQFSELILSQLSFIALKSLSSMSCQVQHTMFFAGCVYTEVALSPTSSSMWPLLEKSVHVTNDFHCEWAIVATQTMASTNETFLPWGSPYRYSD